MAFYIIFITEVDHAYHMFYDQAFNKRLIIITEVNVGPLLWHKLFKLLLFTAACILRCKL